MNCPKCKTEIPDEKIVAEAARINGAKGKGKSKARTSEQARAAVMARWEKPRKLNAQKLSELEQMEDKQIIKLPHFTP
jgi:hypothetical protein